MDHCDPTSTLTGVGFAGFPNTLQSLHLCGCASLTDEGAAALAGLRSLTHLTLCCLNRRDSRLTDMALVGNDCSLRCL